MIIAIGLVTIVLTSVCLMAAKAAENLTFRCYFVTTVRFRNLLFSMDVIGSPHIVRYILQQPVGDKKKQAKTKSITEAVEC